MENLRGLREKNRVEPTKGCRSDRPHATKAAHIEAGTFEPDISTLKVLADFFETSVDYLVGHTDNLRKIEPIREYELNEAEQTLVDRYRGLLQNQRRSLDLFLDSLEGKDKSERNTHRALLFYRRACFSFFFMAYEP